MLNMSVGDDKVARMYSIHSSAPEIVKELARHLIKENKPTAMVGLPMHTNDIIRKNQNVCMFNHMMSIIGYKLGDD